MIAAGRFEFDGGALVAVAASAVLVLAWAIFVIRVIGLRSLAKMSSFDFVVTVALGSVVATTATTTTSVWAGCTAFAALLAIQWTIAQLRRRTGAGRVVDNEPMLLMVGGEPIEDNMRRCRVTSDDLTAKLREANVTDMDQVLAVVMETTGDVSVLHGPGPLDDRLLAGVRRPQRDDAAAS